MPTGQAWVSVLCVFAHSVPAASRPTDQAPGDEVPCPRSLDPYVTELGSEAMPLVSDLCS